MSSKKIVAITFGVCIITVIGALVAIGAYFKNRYKKNKETQGSIDAEYLVYLQRGYTLRFCYAICVAADYLLIILEITATGIGAFISLTPDADTYPIAVLLIISFIASMFRNALNLKYLRRAYAQAFRVLEFALDEYRISNKTDDVKRRLQRENERAQQIIETYNE